MPVSIAQIQKWKHQKKPIAALTASDYAIAKLLDKAGVDMILVGDSLAMVALGYKNTLPVTLDDMIRHAQAVGRGVDNALLIVDMPFLSYQISAEEAMRSAGRIFKETDARGIKLEGGYPDMVETIRKLVQAGMPVMGHVGLTPQSVHRIGYRVQGGTPDTAEEILHQSKALVEAGIFALLLENIPADLATKITELIPVPTIGIGAGQGCDGQILVTHDVLGLSDWQPPFARKYVDLQSSITEVVKQYCQDVRTKS
ncbi:3-methyl-2-oxobutanoate hydroxymethyltransferase [Phormidium tenue]|jgi:3-methyl-2-oxobutanoate hydroxymethyltransferase|uniref:3-methyl-2-oxobutanoate hydroxymethyltransferase n=1 Tax=Phormidium tenue FACHB-1050 TaxID=2692857 RepID=A0ABR8CG38_9CYAN|nr:3-methyl-2-oxobutanoate hydroxymethyltransferase [Phormidium tenue]MBD2319027.1 3-methyl-2-oxobutanoate hydroxymethyltransferase [Phormidium tenue FACHB-1050]